MHTITAWGLLRVAFNCCLPHHHKAVAKSTTASNSRVTLSIPVWRPNTQNNHTVVIYMGTAIHCLKVSIQTPGLGKTLANPGTKPRSKKGAAKPKPSTVKIRSAKAGG